jgi:hypothetical protein
MYKRYFNTVIAAAIIFIGCNVETTNSKLNSEEKKHPYSISTTEYREILVEHKDDKLTFNDLPFNLVLNEDSILFLQRFNKLCQSYQCANDKFSGKGVVSKLEIPDIDPVNNKISGKYSYELKTYPIIENGKLARIYQQIYFDKNIWQSLGPSDNFITNTNKNSLKNSEFNSICDDTKAKLFHTLEVKYGNSDYELEDFLCINCREEQHIINKIWLKEGVLIEVTANSNSSMEEFNYRTGKFNSIPFFEISYTKISNEVKQWRDIEDKRMREEIENERRKEKNKEELKRSLHKDGL